MFVERLLVVYRVQSRLVEIDELKKNIYKLFIVKQIVNTSIIGASNSHQKRVVFV